MATTEALADFGPLQRASVAADNSCLFTTFAKLCAEPAPASEPLLKAAGRELRAVCATAVLADPDPATRAVLLGHDSVAAYGEWIRNEMHWGGEPEIVMLAEHFGVEAVVTSCESMRSLRYGDGGRAVHLLYTGQHYDPLVGAGAAAARSFDDAADAAAAAAREEAALAIARAHNEERARRAKERRVQRLKCAGCGAILADAAAFQLHCGEVDHDDDFTCAAPRRAAQFFGANLRRNSSLRISARHPTALYPTPRRYDCEQVEIVLTEDDALPDGSVDLNAENVHAFYNAAAADAVTLSMRCACAPFQVDEKTYATMEEFWRAQVVDAAAEAAGREALLKRALAAQYATPAAAESGLVAHLLATADQLLVNVDVDPWLGMQAAGGISSGQNVFGKALMALRAELREQ